MCIELSEVRSDEKNDFLIHIYAFQDPETHYLIGSQVIHLYEFVREIHGISSVQLINELSFHVGKFTFEFAWSYGSFGYGFSNQLRNSKNGIFESINHSMFPRIKLSPTDLVDNRVNVRVPKKLRLVTLHSLLLRKAKKSEEGPSEKAAISIKKSKHKKGNSAADYEAKTIVFRRVKFSRGAPVHVSLNLNIHQKFMEDDFNQAYGEFICLRNRTDRLFWLNRLTEGRLRDKVEYDVGDLFSPYKDVEKARRALMVKRPLGCPPAYMEYTEPKRQSCHPIQGTKVEDEDLKFIHEKLASAPRFSGYLNYVFGYDKPPPEDEELKKFEFKIHKKAGKESGQVIKDHRNFCRRWWTGFRSMCFWFKMWILSTYEFLFPAYDRVIESQLPEISLTMPSPQHSTTDFHSFCTQKQVFEQETELEQTRRRATTFIQMTRKVKSNKVNDDVDEEEDEEGEYEVPSMVFIGESKNEDERRPRIPGPKDIGTC